jgi:SAM-dependent methyltransferase
MGINSELIRIMADYRKRDLIKGNRIVELGAQSVCAAPEIVSRILNEYGMGSRNPEPIDTAIRLYAEMGFNEYACIDASGQHGALVFDLNYDLREHHDFHETYDVVTDLGTAEHCFNQYAVFKNLHELCRPDGLMIHALPVQGNVNHGFYNYHPRFFADLAMANKYEIISLSFTVDYKPALFPYTLKNFQRWDSHDLLFYAVLRRMSDASFQPPFDGMFATANQLNGYTAEKTNPLKTIFTPYLKGGRWENTRGRNPCSFWLHYLMKHLQKKWRALVKGN